MKRIVVILTFFVLSFSTWAQLPSDCTAPDLLKNNYEFDVADLTVKWLHEIHSPDTSFIEIPQWAQKPIWEGLAAIYNRHDITEVDSVFNKYCLHSSRSHTRIQQTIYLEVDTSFAWTNNWSLLQTTTGIPALDSLIAKYGFSVYHFYYLAISNNAYVELKTTQSINVLALCDSIMTFPGIVSGYPVGYIGDGSTIVFEYLGDIRFYTFTLAWGDCPAGCTSFHTWKFKVNPDCSIDILGIENHISDDYYPEPKNCNLSSDVPLQSSKQPKVNIFPNPAKEFQTIRTDFPGTMSYILIDGWGRKIVSETFLHETILDLRSLKHGLYLLLIQKAGSLLTTKKIQID